MKNRLHPISGCDRHLHELQQAKLERSLDERLNSQSPGFPLSELGTAIRQYIWGIRGQVFKAEQSSMIGTHDASASVVTGSCDPRHQGQRGATVRADSPVASTRCYLLALTQVPAKSHLHYRNQRLRDLKDSDTLLSSLVSHRKADIRIMFLLLPDPWGWRNGAGKS